MFDVYEPPPHADPPRAKPMAEVPRDTDKERTPAPAGAPAALHPCHYAAPLFVVAVVFAAAAAALPLAMKMWALYTQLSQT